MGLTVARATLLPVRPDIRRLWLPTVVRVTPGTLRVLAQTLLLTVIGVRRIRIRILIWMLVRIKKTCGSLSAGHCQLTSAIPVTCPSGFNALVSDTNAQENSVSLSIGEVVGISVGVALGFVVLVAIIVFVVKRHPKSEVV